MKKSNINYPHPVLNVANEDYIDCSFNISLPNEPRIEGESALIEISYELTSPGLKEMVMNESAKVMVYFESVHSEYRKAFSFPAEKETEVFPIGKNDLSKLLKVKGYVVASKPISQFSLPEHNKTLFGTIPFLNLRVGDILAIAADSYDIPLDSFDPLADRPSIFSIRRQSETKDEIQVDFFSNDKITIFLRDDIFEKYKHLYDAPELRGPLASMFAVPVLVDVLSYIKSAGSEELDSVSDKKWYQVIMSRINDLHIDLPNEHSMTKIANLILPHVFNTYIESTTKVFEGMLPSGGDAR